LSAADPRTRLAERQAALMQALGGAAAPEGFDPGRVRLTADSLARKRARAVARAWPSLAEGLGESFAARFAAYADATPLPAEGGPLADGRGFARHLDARGELPDEARLQALNVDLHHRTTAAGLRPRRGPALKAALLRDPRRLVVAVRLPWLGNRLFTVPLGGAKERPRMNAEER
jgi:hypothetical protein